MESDPRVFARSVIERGWAITPRVLPDLEVGALRAEVAALAIDGRGGIRNLLEHPNVRALAVSATIRSYACAVLGEAAFAVRALLFDKTPLANWKVSWHQDLTIATKERVEVEGYGPWTEKGGVPHVQPPVSVLERMLALRVHLDPCGPGNGPVRVLDGSHRHGRLSGEAIDEFRRRHAETDCIVEQGGILAFRPLLLHASAAATMPGHRRIIHIEFAAGDLAAPLAWHRCVAVDIVLGAR